MKINRFEKVLLLFMALVLTINCGTSPGIPVADAQAREADAGDFAKLRDSITDRMFEFEPEEKRMLGASETAGTLKNWSPEAIKKQVEFCREALKQLNAAQISGPAQWLDREILAAHLSYLEYYYGQYHGELGNLQVTVYPYDLIQYELQRFITGRTGKRDAATARERFGAIKGILRELPGHLEQQQENLLAGLKLRPPDKELLGCLIKRIRSSSKDDSIPTLYCQRKPSGEDKSIRGGLNSLEESLESAEIRPLLPTDLRESLHSLLRRASAAYDLHADFLKRELLPRARDSWALGADEYKRRFTLIYGDGIKLEELVREAEESLARTKEQMISLARKLRPNLPLNKTLEELRAQHPKTEEELLKAYVRVQRKIDDGITRLLGLQVDPPIYVPAPRGVPVSLATNWPAPLMSQGAGIVLVDTSEQGQEENSFVDLPVIAIHEGNPGHATQSLLFQRAFQTGNAPLCRFLNVPDEVGYVRGNWYAMANIEGWAFYVERFLLDSESFTDEERLAALTLQALRAARVVVDFRMHTAGMSRAEVAKYLEDEAGQTPDAAQGQAYRYSKIPLQAVSYYLGAREFEKLDHIYGKRVGEGFYRQLLSLGPVPPKIIGDYFKATMK